MAGLIAVLGGANAPAVAERGAAPLLRRPWQSFHLTCPAPDVALAFAGERGAVVTDERTGVAMAFDGELFLDSGVQSGSEAAQSLLAAYVAAGDAIEPPQGFFAAAIWDPRRQSLALVNDRHGRRPVWIARIGGALVAAPELKALLAAGLEPWIELQTWAEFLAYESALEGHPYLAGTRLLPAASVLVTDRNGRETLRRRWRYRLEPASDGDDRELAAEFGRLLDAAIARRLTADTALALSGGLDSRSVASILRARAPNTVALTWGPRVPTISSSEPGLPRWWDFRIAAVASRPVTSPGRHRKRFGSPKATCAAFTFISGSRASCERATVLARF